MYAKIFTKEFWKQGSGEIIGFMYTLPVLLVLLVMLIGIIQVGALKERLEYTAYVGCRAAVVSKDYDMALKNAKETIKNDLESASIHYEPGSLEVDLKLITETSDKKKKKEWSKGSYLQCTVKVKVRTVTPFISGFKTSKIVMMIERPVDEMGWFD